ncbi:macro domain-containing protein [Acidovorax sp. SUPP2825]|uniref:type II toxin-antitoxin system antitoxin DNA ADP-ribosyl glycohydrolase DarG n=1 Tax=Acidovorax sp. SUPP2825 TaxID=2920879 RepID=UPI0023DE34A4|nr:macro domain-containing protein [Acidovorax sp. SUPP2825]GKS96067.1 macro domain-containing protein [Acidovorax sp. SUPP2825]
MIELTSGDILKDDSDAIVNTVNCVGIMGRGIALQFKNAWPENFKAYKAACDREEVQPGRMFIYDTEQLAAPRYIINFPTKRHWKGKSRMQDIDAGLEALVRDVARMGIRSIAIPPLGSGLGGLEWDEVRPRIEAAMQTLPDVRVRLYEPKGAPQADKMQHSREVPRMTAGRAALVELMNRYVQGLLDPAISLLEVHKLMYFMQEAGEPLRLSYVKAPYGPYAENLRHVLQKIEGHMVAGYADGGDDPTKPLTVVPGAIEEAGAFLGAHVDTRARFDRVGDLVEGFETPFGLELLATVHWVASHTVAGGGVEDVVRETHAWNDRKKQFTPRQIGIALNVLDAKGWLPAEEQVGA